MKQGAKQHAVYRPGHSMALLVALAAGYALPAQAGAPTFGSLKSGLGEGYQFALGEASVSIKGAMGLGSVIRADSQDASLIGSAKSMNTLDDGNRNYQRGDAVSTALEGYIQADIGYRGGGALLSAKGWYDHSLSRQRVPHGNSVNGYRAGEALSDAGFAPLGRFGNLVLDDAYLYAGFRPGGKPLLLRAGLQTIPWETPTTMSGGLAQVNAVDQAALSRASAIPEEGGVAAPALYGKLTLSDKLEIDGFYRFKSEPNVYPGCGTFWSTSDYAQPGCNSMTLNGSLLSALQHQKISTSDAQALGSPIDHVTRAPDRKAGRGEYGVSLHYLLPQAGLLGLYAANIASTRGVTGMVRNGPGLLTPGDANLGLAVPTGLSSQFYRGFPGDIHLFGINFKTRLPDQTGLYAEFSYMPNQPIAWNGSDFLNGLLSGKGPLGYLSNLPVGASAEGYDRFRVGHLILGASRPLGRAGGAQFKLSGELGWKHVAGLPDAWEMRYGRVGWGMAGSKATPGCVAAEDTCRLDGFVTSNAWGARARLEANFAEVRPGLSLTPSLTLAQDVSGYSYDGVFSEGRFTAILGLNMLYRKRYTLDVSYLKTGGGSYNVLGDRSVYTLSVGARL